MIVRKGFDGVALDLHQVRRSATVTDHALVRYLERVRGFDMAGLRRELLTDGVLQAMAMGASSVHAAGFKLIVANFSIVTVLDADAVAMPASDNRRSGR